MPDHGISETPPVPTPDAMAAQIAQELVGEWLMDFELPMYSTCTSSRMDMALRSLREAIAHALDQARAEERAQAEALAEAVRAYAPHRVISVELESDIAYERRRMRWLAVQEALAAYTAGREEGR